VFNRSAATSPNSALKLYLKSLQILYAEYTSQVHPPTAIRSYRGESTISEPLKFQRSRCPQTLLITILQWVATTLISDI
jgi:hypothetical protein